MKFPLAAVSLLLLLVASCSESLALPGGADVTSSCCRIYVTWKIPQNKVQHYYYTSSLCAKPAVIFVTVKGRPICADPEETWVRDYVNRLKEN